MLLLFSKWHDLLEEYELEDELEDELDDEDGDDVELNDLWFNAELTMFVGTSHLSFFIQQKIKHSDYFHEKI